MPREAGRCSIILKQHQLCCSSLIEFEAGGTPVVVRRVSEASFSPCCGGSQIDQRYDAHRIQGSWTGPRDVATKSARLSETAREKHTGAHWHRETCNIPTSAPWLRGMTTNCLTFTLRENGRTRRNGEEKSGPAHAITVSQVCVIPRFPDCRDLPCEALMRSLHPRNGMH